MNVLQFLHALRARIGVFGIVLGATIVTAAAVSLLLPKTYKATVALLVDTRDEQSLSNQSQPFNFNVPQERQSYLQTQMDIVSSRKVARQVARDLKLAQNPSVRAAYEAEGREGTIEDWLADNLLKKLKVETSQSNVIQVTYSAPDAQSAAQIANAFAKAYMDTVLELRVAPTREAAAWFDEQLNGLKANLEAAQAKLTDYLQRQKIVVTGDGRSDDEAVRLGALSEQASRAQEQTVQLNSRAQQARQYLDRGASPDPVPDVRDNGLIQRLKAELSTGEAKLQELATQYGSNYPLYQRQLSQNRSLRERLDSEMKTVVAGIENSARQSRQRDADIASAMAAQRSRILEQRRYRDEVAVLRHNVESAEKAYDTTLQRATVAQVESRARKTNVEVLNPASVPGRASSPRITLNIALSVVIGMMLGIGVVMLMETFDRRVRTRDDFIDAWGVPLLAVINEWHPRRTALLRGPGGSGRPLPSPG